VAAIHRLASGRAPLPSVSDGPGSQRPPPSVAPPRARAGAGETSWKIERIVLAVLLAALVGMAAIALARSRAAPHGSAVPLPAGAHS
jgi:hypothetical protein